MIEYQYYCNHRNYHDSFIDSKLQNDHYDIKSILTAYNNTINDNIIKCDKFFNYTNENYPNNTIDKTSESTNSTVINYEIEELFTDTLLSDDELDFIKEMFDDISSVTSQSTLSESDISSVDSIKVEKTKPKKNAINITSYQQQQEKVLQIMKRNFEEFQKTLQTCIISNNLEELSRRIYQSLHPKCLVRFKLTNISAKSGPKSLIDYFNLLKKAFPDGQKAFTKDKIFSAEGYYIYKRKFVFSGTESSFENTFNLFSYCCNIEDIRHLKDRKDNFVPNKFTIKINSTRYVDPLTYQVVLWDIGLHILSQKSIQ